MSRLARIKRGLRERSEHYLMLDAARRLGSGVPGTVSPYKAREGLLWRRLFVPLYRRVPWTLKRRAMESLRMTARDWTPPERRPREPWRPPPPR
ncbi:MAG: hypothetical protein ABWZ67_09480 [Solirubrobacteraceae bacterium]